LRELPMASVKVSSQPPPSKPLSYSYHFSEWLSFMGFRKKSLRRDINPLRGFISAPSGNSFSWDTPEG
jgi:hypothetical protein